MQNTLYQNQQYTLKGVEDQINILTGILDQRQWKLRFPAALEKSYLDLRNRRLLEIERNILIAGLLFYLAFSWPDFYLGGEQGLLIFILRLLITAGGLLAIAWVPKSAFYDYMVILAAVGVFVAGLSVLVFIALIPDELKYAYHLGLIPIQVFIMVALRLSYRSVLSVSLALFLLYLLAHPLMTHEVNDPSLSRLIDIFIPLFTLFWFLMILMGGYIAFMTETAARNDFLKNKLLALEAQRLQFLTDRLHHMSTTDGLTGIANRRCFERQLDTEWRRCLRNKMPLALVMIDIDRFKDFNDHYGHLSGDDCLIRLAQLMASFCKRPGDLCARYGGEEFVILLAETDENDAVTLLEQIRNSVAELNIPHEKSPYGRVTICAGIAASVPDDGRTAESLLGDADRRLYRAKAAGRNQICCV